MIALNLVGKKFGRLTVIKRNGSYCGASAWLCSCDCGSTGTYSGKAMKSGNTRSCGCLKSEEVIKKNIALSSHGMTKTPTYVSWDSMRQRCYNPNHKSYKDYFGRNIGVCERWINSFENFLEDMGERPKGKTLDRIDNDSGYSPENCRWADIKTQSNNKRSSKFITFNGKTQTCIQWAREFGIEPKTLLYRIKHGWEIKEALTMKSNHGNSWLRGSR